MCYAPTVLLVETKTRFNLAVEVELEKDGVWVIAME